MQHIRRVLIYEISSSRSSVTILGHEASHEGQSVTLCNTERCDCARAGQLPTLELYVTLMRTAVENEYILERAMDGMDLSVAAYFK